MTFFRMPSKALIQALGWDAIVEIDRYLDDVAEEIRAERRRLATTQHEVLYPPGREADLLHRLADVEYHLREEMNRSGQRIRREIHELKEEIRRLRETLPSSQTPIS